MVNNTPSLEINCSRQFTSWLVEECCSIIFTTYQAGKIFLLGIKANGQLSVFERSLERCLGLYTNSKSLYVSTLYQLWRWENHLIRGDKYQDYDALYVPQISYVTGDLDIHDIAVTDTDNQIFFVNTLFSCIATVSSTHSFVPIWKPPFISKLAPEDRCHLNGLAMKDDQPGYVTFVSPSDIYEGWREHRKDGGCIMEIQSNEIIATGLSMPHSPRWYQDRLWLLNSGTGEFGYIELDTGKFIPLTFAPGYLRGLAFHGNYAIVGMSKSRENKTFSGLPFNERLEKEGVSPRCGLIVVDLYTGNIVHSLTTEGVVTELYDVNIVPGITCPMAIGFKNDEIRRMISIGEV